MPNLVKWRWSNSASAKAYMATAKQDPRNMVFALPSESVGPMCGVLTQKFLHSIADDPEHLTTTMTSMIRLAALSAFEGLLKTYEGADLDTSFLMNTVVFKIEKKNGDEWKLPAVVLWDFGTFGLFAPSEINLTDQFYVERLLLLNEISHQRNTS